jgi:predicted RNase H-like nuclease
MTLLRGVDGCPAGWLSVSLDVTTGEIAAAVHEDADSLLGVPAAVTAIDIPIGLPATPPRNCDAEARRRLGARRSSVSPCRCAARWLRARMRRHAPYRRGSAASA